MTKVISFQEALEKGLIKEGHYFKTVATQRSVVTVSEDETGYSENQDFITEAGETKLWRLAKVRKRARDCRLLGPPTEKKLTLRGETGYERGIDTLDKIAVGTNVFPEFFRDVYSCRLSKREYEAERRESETFWKNLKREMIKYKHKDDRRMRYFLASRFTSLGGSDTFWGLFYSVCGGAYASSLHYFNGSVCSYSYAVRPEAIPRSNLLLKTEGCDGSKRKPWVCVLAKEDT